MMLQGSIPWASMYATRDVRVLVLPEPGGARICTILEVVVTARFWAGFRPSRMRVTSASTVFDEGGEEGGGGVLVVVVGSSSFANSISGGIGISS